VIIPPPSISTFSPLEGPVGTVVEIRGSALAQTSAVSFNGVAAVIGPPAATDTLITVTVPGGAATGPITVTTIAGSAQSATDFTLLLPPVVSSFAPASGPVGTPVTIFGSRFAGASAVTFAGTPATTFSPVADSVITAEVPPGATNGPVSVTTPGGTGASSESYFVMNPPSVASFSPASGVVGTEVTILGSGFLEATSVLFGGVAASSFTIDSASTIRANVPASAVTGVIRVVNPAGFGESSLIFTVAAPLEVITLQPAHDTEVKSSNPTSNYGQLATLRTRDGSPLYRSYLKFVVAGLTGSVASAKIRLFCTDASADGGSVYSASNTFSPSGTAWTETTVTWDQQPALLGGVLSSAGSVALNAWAELDVTSAITGNGTFSFAMMSSSTNSAIYNSSEAGSNGPELVIQTGAASLPHVASFAPGAGAVGTEVLVSGSNFSGATLVTFNGSAATFSVDSATQLRANVPAGATTGRIGVTTSAGTGISSVDFVVSVPPQITSFAPASGPAGTEVTISGSNFAGTTSVAFGGVPAASFVVDSDAQIRAVVPAGAVVGPISVVNPAGAAASATDFTPTTPQVVVTLNPAHDAYVKSSNLTGKYGSDASLRTRSGDPTYRSYLKFDVTGLSAPVVSAKLRLYVTDASNHAGSLHSVSNNYAGTSTSWTESGLMWSNSPAISDAALSTVTNVAGGTWAEWNVTSAITGNGVFSFGLQNTSTNSAIFSSGEGANPPELVIVTGGAGTRAGLGSEELAAQLRIRSFSPREGLAGTEVKILGQGFTGTETVHFGEVTASFRVSSEGELLAVVPKGCVSGKIRVSSSAGAAESAEEFLVVSPAAGSSARLPGRLALSTGRPNPFRERTSVQLDLPRDSAVTLVVYNLQGQEVVRLLDGGMLTAGSHEVVWNGRDSSGRKVSAGLYLLRLQSGESELQRKLTLLK
jgi:hypothetical protein